MLTKIGKDYRFGKRTQNMRNRSNVFEKIWKQTVEKIVNSENSKFRKIGNFMDTRVAVTLL